MAHACKKNDTLLNLYLGANSIREEGAVAMAEALRANTRLQKLDLQGASIHAKGSRALADALTVSAAARCPGLCTWEIPPPGNIGGGLAELPPL